MDSIDIIRKLCEENNTNIAKLEKELHYGNGTIRRNKNLKADRLYEIAKYFGVSMEYLVTGFDPSSFYGRLLQLCHNSGFTLEELETQLNLSPGAANNWKLQLPSQALLQKIGDYFHVTSDYLIFGSKDQDLTNRDEQDIAKRLEKTLKDLTEQADLMFSEHPLDDDTRELLKSSLENSLRIAKIQAKQKFTPIKYKK